MYISNFVQDLFNDNSLYTPNNYITVKDAAYDLEQFRAEGWDFEPITPEEYAEQWNRLVKEDAAYRLGF